jgi:hypothetical protein
MAMVHVVEGDIENYASVDNGFLGVKIFNITLNYMNYLYNDMDFEACNFSEKITCIVFYLVS